MKFMVALLASCIALQPALAAASVRCHRGWFFPVCHHVYHNNMLHHHQRRRVIVVHKDVIHKEVIIKNNPAPSQPSPPRQSSHSYVAPISPIR